MLKIFRLLLIALFFAAACEEQTIEPDPELETPQDSVPDLTPSDSVPDTNEPPPADPVVQDAFYYPPVSENGWETIHPDSLGWNQDSLKQLLSFVQHKNTYGFIMLHRGKIVTEKYWNDWNASTQYHIASAGKTVTAFLLGMAQQEGLLSIDKKTSDYLGQGWSNLPIEKENLITLRHHLTMTSGLDEADDACNEATCFTYKVDAGKRWAYHNPPYNLLNKVLTSTSGLTLDEFTKTRLADKIGLRSWAWENNILALSARDMARFGLLILSKGKWNNEAIMSDSTYFSSMIASSNDFNKSYGYLWWLNGKESYMVPGDNTVYSGSLVPSAPADMFAAMGKGDKKIYVVPSLDLVIVRHGDDTGASTFGPSSFDTELWQKLRGVLNLSTN